jgi:hypothetical protein
MPYGALFRNAIKDVGFTTRTLPLGAIIGVAMITRIERTESIRDRLSDEELAFGNYGDARYAFKLDEPLLLPNPVPFKGRQSVLWPLEGEPLEQVWIEIARSVVRTWVPGE